MNISHQIREARKRAGLSQTQLATQSGLGLATVQNIEANRANPAIGTLLAIFSVLGIRMILESANPKMDWQRLAHFGCPLLIREGTALTDPRTRRGLIDATMSVTIDKLSERETKALSAWINAIKDHYPSVWNDLPVVLRSWAANQKPEPKLRRLAMATLAEFL